MDDSPVLLLASASPRRKDLLTSAAIPFEIFSAPVDETAEPGESAATLATRLAHAKAQTSFHAARNDTRYCNRQVTVLGADTVVEIGGQTLGKPNSQADAARMLQLLSGKTHKVITGVALVSESGSQTAFATSEVTFSEITAEEIAEYVASGEPMDKAGAYAIQGRASRWATAIHGSYTNVIGLPVSLVWQLLNTTNA